MTKNTIRSIQTWWCSRADGYARAVLVLGLNIPFLFLALTRYLGGVDLTSVTGVYALVTAVGYYTLALQVVITVVFLLTGFSPRLSIGVTAVLLGISLSYLVIDGVVYRVYRFHIDAFWFQYLVGSSAASGFRGTCCGWAAAPSR